ncbi:MAG TPA: hypothetical protein VKI01_00160 [Acidimicrobiia bacterium]|nr:hypothetical protein [Acidimicrobiia bacterium]
MADAGPLARTVLDYTHTIERLVPAVRNPSDWAPLAEFVAVDEFQRVGTFMEVQDWQRYTEMLTQWASATAKFATTARRVSELPGLVYFEIEERHFRGDATHIVNSLTVFEFDVDGKIRHLDVYLQQER